MTTPGAPTYNLAVGEAVIALGCPTPGLADFLAGWFGRPSSPDHPHIHLDLEILSEPYERPLPNSLITGKVCLDGGRFDIAEGLITGRFDRASGRGTLRIRDILLRGRLVRVLEQVFYQAFHSARTTAGLASFLIHSSAVIRDGQGFLFVGPSEAGKSTIATLSAPYHVLGDEMSLIKPDGTGALLCGTPFNGLFRAKHPGQAPLRAIFLLHKAAGHRLGEVSGPRAATALAAEVVPPVGLDETAGRSTIAQLIEKAVWLLERVPVHRLEFLPDPGFWSPIEAKFLLNSGRAGSDPAGKP